MSSQADATLTADEVRITFRPLTSRVPVANRVRSLLKTAKRRDGLQAVRVEMPKDEANESQPETVR